MTLRQYGEFNPDDDSTQLVLTFDEPAPGAAGPFALAGLCATRRRRRPNPRTNIA